MLAPSLSYAEDDPHRAFTILMYLDAEARSSSAQGFSPTVKRGATQRRNTVTQTRLTWEATTQKTNAEPQYEKLAQQLSPRGHVVRARSDCFEVSIRAGSK